jgi:hypothetical protein
MILITHPSDLEQQQEFLLAMFFYHSFMAESDETDGINMNEKLAAEEAGIEFDKLYHYDNSHKNITNALNFDWDES